jgi:hypothetical protein
VAVDNPTFLLLGLLILALVVGGPFLRSTLSRKGSTLGEDAGRRFSAAQLVKTLDEFGTTVVIHAPEALARQIVAEAAAMRPKDVFPRSDDAYGIRFVEPDDAIVRVVPDPAGTRVQVERFREYMGFPQTAPLWKDLRGRIASTAAARNVSVSEGNPLEYLRGDLIDDRNAGWVLDT